MSSRVGIGVALALAVASLLAARPLEHRLRADAPTRTDYEQVGLGNLVGGVMSGPFRPMFQSYLFLRANHLARQGRMDELLGHYRTLVMLYPANPKARDFLGWHLAFNLKSETRDEAMAWRWSREGLDILMGTPAGRRAVAHWCLAQCGQNAVHPLAPMRYAGPAWDVEKRWRARLGAWARRRFGRELSRFEVGLAALGDADGFYDKSTRATLYEQLAYEQLIRDGRVADLPATKRALAEFGAAIRDNPGLLQTVGQNTNLLLAVERGDLEAIQKFGGLDTEPRAYRAAAALAGRALARRDATTLEAAHRLLQSLDQILDKDTALFAPELAALRAWLTHLRGEANDAAPPLPFDFD